MVARPLTMMLVQDTLAGIVIVIAIRQENVRHDLQILHLVQAQAQRPQEQIGSQKNLTSITEGRSKKSALNYSLA